MTSYEKCPVCEGQFVTAMRPWLKTCSICGFLQSSLSFQQNQVAAGAIDEYQREHGLEYLRLKNFAVILDVLEKFKHSPRAKLLDVGCAHGWFLKMARDKGWLATGIEPDSTLAAKAELDGLDVRRGFFPNVLVKNEKFDVISFNDVFEHLPDPADALKCCFDHLTDRGLLAVNLPVAEGTFYRISKCLLRLGVAGPFERMWQVHFTSPHLSYFTRRQLRALAQKSGFESIHSQRLPSVSIRGLWSRLRYENEMSRGSALAIWLGTLLLQPFLSLLPADIALEVFNKC